MSVLEDMLSRLLGFQGYVIRRETLYLVGLALLFLLSGLILSSYDTFILALSLTLPVLMLPLIVMPLLYKTSVKVYRRTDTGLAGSQAHVELEVYNESKIPVLIYIKEYSPTLGFSEKHVIGVEGGAEKKIVYNIRGRVGRHRILSDIIVYDPLGLIGLRNRVKVDGAQTIKFKPRIHEVKTLPIGYFAQIVPGGGFKSNLRGLGYEFYGLRKYVYGDPIKLVDWKTTARHGELYVKEYILETGSRILLALLLTKASFTGKPSFFEEASEAFASITNRLLSSGSGVGLVVGAPSFNGIVEAGQGKTILNNVVETLSNVPWLDEGEPDLEAFAKNILKASRHPRNTRLVILAHVQGGNDMELYEKVLKLKETGFEKVNLIVADKRIGVEDNLRLLEEKGVETSIIEETSRDIIVERILDVIRR